MNTTKSDDSIDIYNPPTTPPSTLQTDLLSRLSTIDKFDYSNTDLVIYHGGCPDGVAGAWCFWKYILNKDSTKCYPGKFNETPPDVNNKNVVFVDFSYQYDVMESLIKQAKSIRVLDHHKSAMNITNIESSTFSYVFDMNRSGAQIAWDEVMVDNKQTVDNTQLLVAPPVPAPQSVSTPLVPAPQSVSTPLASNDRPWFINDIGDRDLWKWERVNSKDTTRSMFGLGYYDSFEKFDGLTTIDVNIMIQTGKILNDSDERQYDAICRRSIDCIAVAHSYTKKAWKVRIVECDHSIASEVGNRLVKDKLCDFAIMFRYNVKNDEWILSCRSLKGQNIDLTTILKEFDPRAGGHAEAAGMTLKGSNAMQKYFKPVNKSFVRQAAEDEKTN